MRPHGRAHISARSPSALGVCDRCGFLYNLVSLKWQYQWAGVQLQNLRILVCQSCLDTPQEQLRTIVLPPDPVPVMNSRPENYTLDDAPIQGLGTNIGTMTQWGGLAAAFDYNLIKPQRLCATVVAATASFTNTVGKRWSVAAQPVPSDAETQQVNVTRFTLYAPSDAKFWSLGAVDYALQGSNDNSTWTTLYNATGAGTVAELIDISTGITSGQYSYHRMAFSGTGGGLISLAQFVIYGTGLSQGGA